RKYMPRNTSAGLIQHEGSILSQLQCWFSGRSVSGNSLTGTSSLSRKPSCCRKMPSDSSFGKYMFSLTWFQNEASSISLKLIRAISFSYFSGEVLFTYLMASFAYSMHQQAMVLVYQLLFTLFSYS